MKINRFKIPLKHRSILTRLQQVHHFLALLQAAFNGAFMVGLLGDVQQQSGDAIRPSTVRLVEQSGQIWGHLFVGQIVFGLRSECVLP